MTKNIELETIVSEDMGEDFDDIRKYEKKMHKWFFNRVKECNNESESERIKEAFLKLIVFTNNKKMYVVKRQQELAILDYMVSYIQKGMLDDKTRSELKSIIENCQSD